MFANATLAEAPKRPMFHLVAKLNMNGTKSRVKFLYNRQKDLCYYLARPNENPQFFSLYDYVMNFSNFPQRCPLNDTFYWIRDFRMSTGTFPRWFPKAFINIAVTSYEKGNNEATDYWFKYILHVEITKAQ